MARYCPASRIIYRFGGTEGQNHQGAQGEAGGALGILGGVLLAGNKNF
jgi:hypothetical protein